MQITVTKREGTRVPFNADKINKSIERACAGIDDPINKVVQIASETNLMLYDGITEDELDYATINAALQNVQEDVIYDKIATRLLLKTVYKRIFIPYRNDNNILKDVYQASFKKYVEDGVADGKLDSRMLKFDLEKLGHSLVIERDELFQYAGISTLLNRYAMADKQKKTIEPPQYFFMRVAMGLSYNEQDPTAQALTFYEKMSKLEYIAGGSTNIGAGTPNPSLSNCFLLEIQDDMDSIAKSVSDVMKISKATGGIGASITKLRASGSPLSSNNTTSSGPTPFAKIIDVAIHAIQRGGKKTGALCFYMENWHLDFPEYLMWRHNAGDDHMRMRTANTAVWLSDEFMKRVERGEMWYMFDPKDVPDLNELYGEAFSKRYTEYVALAESGRLKNFKKVLAEDQYRQILVMLETTSHPWITFKDPVNLRALNNNTGTIHMSNLCTEICLPQDRDNIAVCNLASLNIARHIANGRVDWKELETTVRAMVRHLDNLIDINVLPIAEAVKSDKENRAVGIGVMGLSEAIELMKLGYEDQAAYDFTDKLFEFISYMAIDESASLAQSRGAYQNFPGSQWSKGRVPFDTLADLEAVRGMPVTVDRISHAAELGINWETLREKVKKGIRNATLMAVAPNANIGLVAGTTPGIDPRFAQVFSRNKISGKYLDINHNLFNELKERGLWESVKAELIEKQGDITQMDKIPEDLKHRYRSAFTTSPMAFIEVAARAQKWVDQALSRNMYLETREMGDLMNVYKTAWQKGLKTTYYLHMKPRHTAEQSTVDVNKRTKLGKIGFGAVSSPAPAKEPEFQAVQPLPTPVSLPVEQPIAATFASAPAPTPIQKEISEAEYQAMMAKVTAVSRKAETAGPEDPQEKLVCDSCQ